MERIDCFLVAYHKLSSLNPVIHVKSSNLLRLFYFPVDRMHWTVLPFLAVCFVVSFLFRFYVLYGIGGAGVMSSFDRGPAHFWSDLSSTVFSYSSYLLAGRYSFWTCRRWLNMYEAIQLHTDVFILCDFPYLLLIFSSNLYIFSVVANFVWETL